MARFVYRERNGQVQSVLVPKIPLRGEDAELGFHERVLKAYYQLECNGERLQGPYPKSMIKRVHQEAIALGA